MDHNRSLNSTEISPLIQTHTLWLNNMHAYVWSATVTACTAVQIILKGKGFFVLSFFFYVGHCRMGSPLTSDMVKHECR